MRVHLDPPFAMILRRRHGFAMLIAMIAAMALLGEAMAEQRDDGPMSGGEALLGGESCQLADGEGGVVAAVIDGDTLQLDGGLVVRLAGIEAPKPPLDRPAALAWPLAEAARAELERIALGQAVQLRYGGTRRDRYGRALAQVYVLTEEGEAIWLQRRMVDAGLARVYPVGDDRQCVGELMASERRARHSALGLWSDPYYLIRSATDPALVQRHDSYDLVEGRILSVGERGPIVYLDFGLRWSTDFTVVLSGETTAALAAMGWQPADLRGRRVRVRGWIEQRGGPSVRVTHTEQLELLDDGGR